MVQIQMVVQGMCDLVKLGFDTAHVAIGTAGQGVVNVLQVLHLVAGK